MSLADIVKGAGTFFRGFYDSKILAKPEDANAPKITRRTAAKAIAATVGAAALATTEIACLRKQLYGMPIARPVKGQISDEAAEWFKGYGLVRSIEEPFLEILNEVLAKFNYFLPSDLSIEAKGSMGHLTGNIDGFAAGLFTERYEVHGLNLRHFERIYLIEGLEKAISIPITAHEAVHDTNKSELASRLMEIRFPLMADLEFDSFAQKTGNKFFRTGAYHLINQIMPIQEDISGKFREYVCNMVAAALALVQNDGSFLAAHEALTLERELYFERAVNLVNYSTVMPDVDGVEVHYPVEYVQVDPKTIKDVYKVKLETKSHLEVTVKALVNTALALAIDKETTRIGTYTDKKAKDLRTLSRIQAYSQNDPTVLVKECNTMYKPGFVHPDFTPDDRIPKGE